MLVYSLYDGRQIHVKFIENSASRITVSLINNGVVEKTINTTVINFTHAEEGNSEFELKNIFKDNTYRTFSVLEEKSDERNVCCALQDRYLDQLLKKMHMHI